MWWLSVLIVAKCIVNLENKLGVEKNESVLIVAKCIVNDSNWNNPKSVPIVLIVAKCIVNIIPFALEFLCQLY